jgi:hypothetical protein
MTAAGGATLLARYRSMTLEQVADEVAAAFLMPLQVIRSQLRNLMVARLADLKRQWGVSMQALIELAYRTDLISSGQRTLLYKLFSVRGWQTHEPVSDELPPGTPSLAATIGRTLFGAGAFCRRHRPSGGTRAFGGQRDLPSTSSKASGPAMTA